MKASDIRVRLNPHAEASVIEFLEELNLDYEVDEKSDGDVVGLSDILGPPTIELEKEGLGTIRYYGHPEGLERKMFVEIVKILRGERELEKDIQERAEKIKKISAEFTIFVAPFCIHCLKVVRKLLQFSVVNPRVSVSVVDVWRYKDVQEKLGIVSVPVMFVGKIRITGEKSLEELIEIAERYNDPNYLSEYVTNMIGCGRVKELQTLPIEFERILPQLLKSGDFVLRLGVMYLFEELGRSKSPIDLEALRNKLLNLLQDEDLRVREDAIMALGKIGGKDELRILKEMLEKESGQIREALAEAIEEIKSRISGGIVESEESVESSRMR